MKDGSPELLLQRIAKLQSSGEKYFAEGIFPSYRYHTYLPYSFPDDNIFFTASVVFILNSYKEFFNKEYQSLIKDVSEKAIKNYRFYENNEGLKLYNFWRTKPGDNFRPNEWFLKNNRNKKWARKLFRLAEDIDDTALIYLTSPFEKSDILQLHDCLIYNANLSRRKIKNTLAKYREIRAYSTWFGSIKAPIEFDICAMSNMLLLILNSGLKFSEQDLATVDLLKNVIDNSTYFGYSHVLSPFYLRTATILYHLSRLISKSGNHYSKIHKEKLIKDIKLLSGKTNSIFELILLSTSLMKLDEKPLDFNAENLAEKTVNEFWFCVENIASIENKISFSLGRYSLFHIGFRCRAHTLSLLWEYRTLKKVKK
ncbi:MAG: hypothetical protein PVH88_20720 [Ignavibacteria bacterium]